jgi:hypothetical protein
MFDLEMRALDIQIFCAPWRVVASTVTVTRGHKARSADVDLEIRVLLIS